MKNIEEPLCYPKSPWLRFCIALILLAIAALAMASRGDLVNADTLTSLAFASDLIQHQNSSWILAPAPAVLSEILPSLLAIILSENPYTRLSLIQFCQLVMLFLCLYLFGRTLRLRNTYFLSITTVVILSFGVIFQNFWLFHIVNNMHMGAAYLGLISLCLFVRILEQDGTRTVRYLMLLWLLGTLAIVESKLYYIHFTLPAITILFFISFKKDALISKKRALTYSAILAISAAIGITIARQFPILNATENLSPINLNSIKISASVLYETAQYFLFHYGDPSIRTIVFIAVYLIFRHFGGTQSPPEDRPEMIILYIWIILSSILITTIFALTGRFRMPIYDLRYFTLPLIIVAYLLVNSATKHFSPKVIFIFIFTIFLFPLVSFIRGYQTDEQYDPLIHCLISLKKDASLKDGITGYWFTKPLYYYSNKQIHMAQLTPDFQPFNWMNRTNLLTKKDDGEKPYFNFIIEDWWLTDEKIVSKFGKADRIFKCKAGPFNNGFEKFKDTLVRIHFYDGSTLNNYIKTLSAPKNLQFLEEK